MSNRSRILVGATLVLGLLFWGGYRLLSGPEWQQLSAAALWQTLASAQPSYLLLGAAFTFASYLFRSYRWRTFLRPMKNASVRNIFTATLVGFSAVALLSRAGEVVRPWMIAQKESLPLSSQFGAWTLERVFDSLTMVALLGAALWLAPAPAAPGAQAAAMMARFRAAGVALTAIALAMAAGLAFLRYAPQTTETVILTLARPLPHRWRDALLRALEHFAATLAVIQDAKRFLACAGWSVGVWVTLLGAYWCGAHAFGQPLEGLDWGAMTLVMMAAVVGSLAQLPAVGGGTQLAAALTLTELFGVPVAAATSAAIAIWVMTFLLVLIPGVPLAAREGLSWSRLRDLLRSSATREQA